MIITIIAASVAPLPAKTDAERLVRMQLASCSLRHCRKITTMTTERRIMMDAPDYWFRFERGLLAPEEKPTPSEAAAYIAYLRADIADLKRELEAAKRKKQMVKEGFASQVNFDAVLCSG